MISATSERLMVGEGQCLWCGDPRSEAMLTCALFKIRTRTIYVLDILKVSMVSRSTCPFPTHWCLFSDVDLTIRTPRTLVLQPPRHTRPCSSTRLPSDEDTRLVSICLRLHLPLLGMIRCAHFTSDDFLRHADLSRRQVLGETGITLNYDELVVYRSEAIIPTYLVIYG